MQDMRTLVFPIAVAVSLFSGAVAAQDNSSWDRIVLEEKAGNVMTSTGGEYETAAVGKQLQVGEHMMLSGSAVKAKVVYYDVDSDGNTLRKCVRDYTDANTYIIDAVCVPAAGWAASPGKTALIVGGTAVAAALLLDNAGSKDAPISPGAR
jgi:hypothetical protein